MSKLQKALEMLRNGKQVNPATRQALEPANRRSGAVLPQNPPAGGQRRQRVHVRTRYFPEGGSADELLPDLSVSVTLETLREHGLQPQDTELELVAQQFRRIKRPILNTAFGVGVPESENANVIMLASALPRSGKTFCSFNLAISISRERDVGAVIVDADVLRPSISHAFGLDDRIGLIDYLLEPSIAIDDILVTTDVHGIVVVPAGKQNEEATELLASRRMKKFVKTLSERFRARAIIVDTPPLLLTNEAHVLAEHMGQIILVVEAGVTSQESVIQTLASLDRSKPINVILNKARGASFGEYSGNDYGYSSVPHRGRIYAKKEV